MGVLARIGVDADEVVSDVQARGVGGEQVGIGTAIDRRNRRHRAIGAIDECRTPLGVHEDGGGLGARVDRTRGVEGRERGEEGRRRRGRAVHEEAVLTDVQDGPRLEEVELRGAVDARVEAGREDRILDGDRVGDGIDEEVGRADAAGGQRDRSARNAGDADAERAGNRRERDIDRGTDSSRIPPEHQSGTPGDHCVRLDEQGVVEEVVAQGGHGGHRVSGRVGDHDGRRRARGDVDPPNLDRHARRARRAALDVVHDVADRVPGERRGHGAEVDLLAGITPYDLHPAGAEVVLDEDERVVRATRESAEARVRRVRLVPLQLHDIRLMDLEPPGDSPLADGRVRRQDLDLDVEGARTGRDMGRPRRLGAVRDGEEAVDEHDGLGRQGPHAHGDARPVDPSVERGLDHLRRDERLDRGTAAPVPGVIPSTSAARRETQAEKGEKGHAGEGRSHGAPRGDGIDRTTCFMSRARTKAGCRRFNGR
ncbi:MAG: hypothetical protein R3F20_16010 [Planctomycetota bacterium]